MTRDCDGPRRRGRALIGLALLGAFFGAAAAAVAVFHVGVLAGLALAGAGFAVYAVPAVLLGWPLPTLDDLVALAAALLGGIAALLLALYD